MPKYEYRVVDRARGPVQQRGQNKHLIRIFDANAAVALVVTSLRSGNHGAMLEVDRQLLADDGRGTGYVLWRRYHVDADGNVKRGDRVIAQPPSAPVELAQEKVTMDDYLKRKLAERTRLAKPGAWEREQAVIRTALDRIPEIVGDAELIGEWAPLLEVPLGDDAARAASSRLVTMLAEAGIRTSNDRLGVARVLLHVHVGDLMAAAQKVRAESDAGCAEMMRSR
jgi:hypothetical protein